MASPTPAPAPTPKPAPVDEKIGNNNMQKEEIVRTNPAVEAMVVLIDTVDQIQKEAAGLEYLESYVTYPFSFSI